MEGTRKTVQLVPDGHGGAFLPIPDEMLVHLGWQVGDPIELLWDDDAPSYLILRRASEPPVLHDTLPDT